MLQIETPTNAPITSRGGLGKDDTKASSDFAKLWDAQDVSTTLGPDVEQLPEEEDVADVEPTLGDLPIQNGLSTKVGELPEATGLKPVDAGDTEADLLLSTGTKTDTGSQVQDANQRPTVPLQSNALTGTSAAVMAALSPQPATTGPAVAELLPQNTTSGPANLGRDVPTPSTPAAVAHPEAIRKPTPDAGQATFDRDGKLVSVQATNSNAGANTQTKVPPNSLQNPQSAAAGSQMGMNQLLKEGPLTETPATELEFAQQIGTNSTTTTTARAQSAHPMQAHSPQVAQQVASATIQSQGGRTEILLNPEELGRVRIAMTTSEAGITVSIMTERPETADLMRRNLEDLAREFRELGYDSVTFTFGDEGDGSENGPDDQNAPDTVENNTPEILTTPPITTVALRSGLDLKL